MLGSDALKELLVLIFLFCGSLADVLVFSLNSNVTITSFVDLPALFGPSLPLFGLKGVVNYVSDGCGDLPPPPNGKPVHVVWIALVKRYNCSFVRKVLNAQTAGYGAVIVHNVESNAVEAMNADTSGEDVYIPSVFVGEQSGLQIKENYLYGQGYYVLITDDLPFNFQNYLLPFAITIGICFVLMLTFMIVKCVRDIRYSRRHRMSWSALKKLPIHKFKKGDPYDCCAICLEDYADSDKLRILPCNHAYHTKCIDPWLTKNRRVCPVCKRKVFASDERPSDVETDSDDETSPLINAEGGTQGGTFTRQRENPFEEATRLAEERRRRRETSGGRMGRYQRVSVSSDQEDETAVSGNDDNDGDASDNSSNGSRVANQGHASVSVIVHGTAHAMQSECGSFYSQCSTSVSDHSCTSPQGTSPQSAITSPTTPTSDDRVCVTPTSCGTNSPPPEPPEDTGESGECREVNV